MNRAELSLLSDTALRLRYTAVADHISNDWRRMAPGQLSDVFDLALLRLEAEIRSLSLTPISALAGKDQGVLFDVDENGDLTAN